MKNKFNLSYCRINFHQNLKSEVCTWSLGVAASNHVVLELLPLGSPMGPQIVEPRHLPLAAVALNLSNLRALPVLELPFDRLVVLASLSRRHLIQTSVHLVFVLLLWSGLLHHLRARGRLLRSLSAWLAELLNGCLNRLPASCSQDLVLPTLSQWIPWLGSLGLLLIRLLPIVSSIKLFHVLKERGVSLHSKQIWWMRLYGVGIGL